MAVFTHHRPKEVRIMFRLAPRQIRWLAERVGNGKRWVRETSAILEALELLHTYAGKASLRRKIPGPSSETVEEQGGPRQRKTIRLRQDQVAIVEDMVGAIGAETVAEVFSRAVELLITVS